jgi:hypothetical protein
MAVEMFALAHASKQLHNNKAFMLQACSKCDIPLKWASEKLLKDRDVVLAVVKRNGHNLQDAANTGTFDNGGPMYMFKLGGGEVMMDDEEGASARLKNTQVVVLAAVKQDRRALRQASAEQKNGIRIMMLLTAANKHMWSKAQGDASLVTIPGFHRVVVDLVGFVTRR